MLTSPILQIEELETRDCPSITYHGGPLVNHPNVHVVFYGDSWADGGDRQLDTMYLNWDVQAIVQGPYTDNLAVYGISRGMVVDPIILDAPLNGQGWLDNSLITAELRPLTYGTRPNDIWVVFVEPGVAVSVTSTFQSYNSQTDFAGYHSELYDGRAFHPYSVIPWPGAVDGSQYPNLPAWGPIFQKNNGISLSTFNEVTGAVSHEYVESVTDPYLTGWFQGLQINGEIGDLAMGDVFYYGDIIVQGVVLPDGRLAPHPRLS